MEVHTGILAAVLAREIPRLEDPELLAERIFRLMGRSPRGRGFDTGGRLDIALVIRDELWRKGRIAGANPNDAETRAWELSRVVIETLMGKPYEEAA